MSGIIFTCKMCGARVPKEEIFQHRLNVHGLKKTMKGKKAFTPASSSPALDRLTAIRKEVDSAIKDLEYERDGLHTIASYKKMLITNGH